MVTEARIRIDEFTDPLCPWAWSAEPFRRWLRWTYGDAIDWVPRMVVLADDPSEQQEKGFDPEMLSKSMRSMAREYKMPADTRERAYVPGSVDACRAVVAARTHGTEAQARRLLRQFRVCHFRGEQIDQDEVIERAALDSGIDPAELSEWVASNETAAALEADRADAREPSPAAAVLDHKLADWPGGRRYTCPSYEIAGLSDGGARMAAPGFQPLAVYETIIANLAPELDRRPAPESVGELLASAPPPLATQEVAVACEIPYDQAFEELGRLAELDPIGADGLWALS